MIAIIKIKNESPDRIIIPIDSFEALENTKQIALEYLREGKKISFHLYDDEDFFEMENSMKCEDQS